MELNREKDRRQHGFTLIEIIAVLVILGILAIVAIPKFLNLQNDARKKAASGLVAAAQSQLTLQYGENNLNSSSEESDPSNICNKVEISSDNASLSCTGTFNDSVTISATVEGQMANGTWNSPDK